MAHPYAQLRAQMSADAQAKAEEHARALRDGDVQAFLAAHPALTPVLEAMAAPLHACFGPHTAVLDVLTDGEEGDFLRLTVHLPHATLRGADLALACFDQAWWVHHCQDTEGLLVVDYSLDDA